MSAAWVEAFLEMMSVERGAARNPAYAEADVHVEVGEGSHQQAVDAVLAALTAHLEGQSQ